MKLKIDQKNGIIFSGNGSRRVVLDYTSGVVYPFHSPETILATFERDGWLMPAQPRWSSGGWGRPGRGDADGNARWENARYILTAIEARVNQLNINDLANATELEQMAKLAAQFEDLRRDLKKRGLENEISVSMKHHEAPKKVTIAGNENGWRGYTAKTKRGVNPLELVAGFERAVQTFLEGRAGTVVAGDYTVTANLITQRGGVVVAFRDPGGAVYMNSQILQMSRFEQTFLNGESVIQNAVRKIAKYSIPFNVLASAGLKLQETKILENGPQETFKLRDGEDRHFTGALLLENAGRKFLMDVDRIEILHGIFNAFFVEVSPGVTTIADAYESMKPQEVKDAEAAGVEVKRQGEWFFIPTAFEVTATSDQISSWVPAEDNGEWKGVVRKSIAHGKGRPNELYQPVGYGELDQYVCGVVSHSGREHKDLNLGMWGEDAKDVDAMYEAQRFDYDPKTHARTSRKTTFKLWKVIGNTTVSNFTIQGAVD